jgi:flagellar protein FlbB
VASGKGIGKTIVLIFLILILMLAGLMWFDYLGVIQAKKVFAPVYKLFGLSPQTSTTATVSKPLVADLDDDRFAKRLESLDIRTEELDKRETAVTETESKNEEVAKELEDRKNSQDEREKTFNNTVKKYDDREVNIAQIATNLTSMQPKKAVDILVAMDDQDVIDVLRKVEEQAQASKTASMVSYWLTLMPAERAAEIQRKMANKPVTLD